MPRKPVPRKRARKPEVQKLVDIAYLHSKGKVSSKGWVVIPKAIRDALDIAPGDELSFTIFPPSPGMKQDKRLSSIHVIKTPKTRREAVQLIAGMFPQRPGEELWTEGLLRDRREEREREERGLPPPPRVRRRKTV